MPLRPVPLCGQLCFESGALIDTVVMGGTPVGPTVGAFKDLNEEGVCLTYTDYDDLFRMLKEEHAVTDKARKDFLQRNSWDNLVDVIYKGNLEKPHILSEDILKNKKIFSFRREQVAVLRLESPLFAAICGSRPALRAHLSRSQHRIPEHIVHKVRKSNAELRP